jgi:FkbM family methyltransferase
MRDMTLLLVKNFLFHVACLGSERRYFAAKGRLLLLASRAGVYERRFMRLLPWFVRPGSDAVDAGANFGAYSLELAALVGPAGRLFSFEPVPPAAEFLEAICRGMPHVTVIREVLSDGARPDVTLRVPLLPGGVPEPALATIDFAGAPHGRLETWRVVRAPARRLDDHLARFRDVSFVKADVEGHEAAFLAGATRTVRAFRPVLQVESAGIRRDEPMVRDWSLAHDYAVFNVWGRQLEPAVSGGPYSLNVYLIPADAVARLPAHLFRRMGSAG